MATSKPAKPADSGAAEKSTLSSLAGTTRSTMPYLVATGIALAMMAWYLFAYVPEKLNYFVGLRFRNLAVASGQVKSKIENLTKALGGAAKTVPNDIDKYLDIVVPEIRIDEPPPPSLSLSADGKRVKVAWADITKQAAFASQDVFDDLVVADATGEVVWQRERTSPRIGNLREVVNAKAEAGGWLPFSLSWSVQSTALEAESKQGIPETATLKPVNLNGTASYVLVQELTLPAASDGIPSDGIVLPPGSPAASSTKLYVAGMVSRRALQAQAMHIPTAYVLALAIPMALLFLTIPFLKLATLTSKERYRFADVFFLVAAAITAAGMAGMLPFLPPTVTNQSDQMLSDFAKKIESEFATETGQILDLSEQIVKKRDAIRKELRTCPVATQNPTTRVNLSLKRCGLWQAMHSAGLKSAPKGGPLASLELDVAIWVDTAGNQTEKWSTKAQVTAAAPHRDFEHFRNILGDNTWHLDNEKRRFTIEPLRAPTTAELGVVFAIPQENSNEFLALNVRPQTLVDTVVAPGYGFAILAPTGRVLFHSQESLGLEENFFLETGNPGDMGAKARSAREVNWTTDYHGRSHRLFMRRLDKFVDCPWLIVTFQELEPVLGATVRQQGAAVRLFSINLLIMLLALGVVVIDWKIRGKDVLDQIMAASSVDSKTTEVCKHSLMWLVPLAGVSIVMIGLTYLPEAQQALDLFYLFFALLPLLAFGIAAYFRGRGAKAMREGDPAIVSPGINYRLLAIELSLVVCLAGAIPAAGFSRIVFRLQQPEIAERGMEDTLRTWSERRMRVLDRVNGKSYVQAAKDCSKDVQTAEDCSRNLVKEGFARDVEALPNYAYLQMDARHGIEIVPRPASPLPEEPLERSLLNRVLTWAPPPFQQESSTASKVRSLKGAKLQTANVETGLPVFQASLNPGSMWADLFALLMLPAVIILGAVVAGVTWARQKLAVLPVMDPPSLEVQLQAVPKKGNEIVLLIGTPRSGKDQTAVKALGKFKRPNAPADWPLRIALTDEKLTDAFVGRKLLEIEQQEQDVLRLDIQGRFWIHVSNLETQLINSDNRAEVMRLLERLLALERGTTPRALIVTSSVDPIAHFEELFQEECRGIYDDAIPEVELSRTALLLTRFRRCFSDVRARDKHETLWPPKDRDPWNKWLHYKPGEWEDTLNKEVAGYPPLKFIEDELNQAWEKVPAVSSDSLARAIRSKAEAAYSLLWSSCTRSEKLVLVQLAQEGFVNPKSREVVAQLVSKGLIIQRPALAVFNYTFRAYLRNIERDHIIQEWERMEGAGLWQVSGRLIASLLLASGIFFLVTQDFPVQSLLPIISGSGLFGLPLVRTIMAHFSSKAPGSPVAG